MTSIIITNESLLSVSSHTSYLLLLPFLVINETKKGSNTYTNSESVREKEKERKRT